MLVQKGIRIYHRDYMFMSNPLTSLSFIPQLKGNDDDEAQNLLERALAVNLTADGYESQSVATINNNPYFHHNVANYIVANKLPPGDAKNDHLRKAESCSREAVRASLIINGSTHTYTLLYRSRLTMNEPSMLRGLYPNSQDDDMDTNMDENVIKDKNKKKE